MKRLFVLQQMSDSYIQSSQLLFSFFEKQGQCVASPLERGLGGV